MKPKAIDDRIYSGYTTMTIWGIEIVNTEYTDGRREGRGSNLSDGSSIRWSLPKNW